MIKKIKTEEWQEDKLYGKKVEDYLVCDEKDELV